MNAQLRELLREARCPNTFGGHPDTCGWCTSRAEALATLAAGDGDYLRVMRNLEREYPMDAKVIAAYIARLHDGIRRLAAPSKEAGPLDELTREQERLGLYAAPQADQQGVTLEGDALRGALREVVISVRLGVTRMSPSLLAYIERALASKASPDDQRQEGAIFRRALENKGWVGPASDFKPEEEVIQTRILRILLSQHDADLSLPTEAAAAVGSMVMVPSPAGTSLLVSREIANDSTKVRRIGEAMQDALSPTASAAREGL